MKILIQKSLFRKLPVFHKIHKKFQTINIFSSPRNQNYSTQRAKAFWKHTSSKVIFVQVLVLLASFKPGTQPVWSNREYLGCVWSLGDVALVSFLQISP